jgi:hypothetical protein
VMAHTLYQRIDDGPMEPGEFRITEGGMGERVCTVSCPRCGAQGQVSAVAALLSWACPSESCPFVDYLLMEEVLR